MTLFQNTLDVNVSSEEIAFVAFVFPLIILHQTRLHSSRMHTARLLPVSPSMHCAWVSTPGGCLLMGGLLPGGVCSWRGAWSQGMSAPGVSASGQGGGVPTSGPKGVYPSMQWGGPPPPVDKILDTCYRKYYLAPTSLWAVIMVNKPSLGTDKRKSHSTGGWTSLYTIVCIAYWRQNLPIS